MKSFLVPALLPISFAACAQQSVGVNFDINPNTFFAGPVNGQDGWQVISMPIGLQTFSLEFVKTTKILM